VRRRPCARSIALCGIFVALAAWPGSASTAEVLISSRQVPPNGQITVGFELARPGTVLFSIIRTAPARRNVGAFEVRGRAGPNSFLFPGRIDRRLLRPGTYRLAAKFGNARAVSPPFVVPTAPERAEPSNGEGGSLRTLVLVCLLVAIALLGVATLPVRAIREPRGAELLVSARPGLAIAGFVALAAGFALYVASS
jgi:hypothetical protein